MSDATNRGDVRSAFQYGLLIFTLTALLGLANATQLFGALDRAALLTHLHSGTLGWITMGVVGLAIWIFGGTGMNTAVRLSAASTAAYVEGKAALSHPVAFTAPVMGLAALLGIATLLARLQEAPVTVAARMRA